MTVCAITGNTAVIESTAPPTRCSVAIIALVIAADMLWCFAARANAVVALLALHWRTDEESALMAADAVHFPMPAAQWKTRDEVVKIVGYGIQILALQPDPQE
jgi:hypothetical protein